MLNNKVWLGHMAIDVALNDLPIGIHQLFMALTESGGFEGIHDVVRYETTRLNMHEEYNISAGEQHFISMPSEFGEVYNVYLHVTGDCLFVYYQQLTPENHYIQQENYVTV